MGCTASKGVPDQVNVADRNSRVGRISTLDFTTSTEFFRHSSSLLLWKPKSSSSRSSKKISVFDEFKKQIKEEEKKFMSESAIR